MQLSIYKFCQQNSEISLSTDVCYINAMKYSSIIVYLIIFSFIPSLYSTNTEDNEFAEFEDFDEDVEETRPELKQQDSSPQTEGDAQSPKSQTEDDTAEEEEAIVEDDDEFEHLQDSDEFEGLDQKSNAKGKTEPETLTITKIPHHLRTNWDSYYLEILMLSGLAVYFLNFLAGKSKNHRIAQSWLNAHKKLLSDNFAIVGDDGQGTDITEPGSNELLKESENVYSLWCTGRVGCEGMLVTLRLLKRHDLVTSLARIFKPQQDQLTIRINMDANEMDSFVLLIANKKLSTRLQKDMNDLSLYSTEKKNPEKYEIPTSFTLMSEIGEATAAVLDRRMVAALNNHEKSISYIHISDQYSGQKQQDDTQPQAVVPQTKKVLIFCFNLDSETKDMNEVQKLMTVVLNCLDKVKRIRLSKEAKMKADKNRARVEEKFHKAAHAQRQEAAQARRDEKRRAEKERIMNEGDPEKQRKLEEKENRKEARKRVPKMKMMKVKA
ncbi:DgyrCDS6056 [Dimorphilus gyrociliatus]|uniref:PAT complex subunit CCDC47 n=1 Tax=Dimorphilus gyrociliatus TaxID=2664684 RepID=A0A7I8VM03_9ANNE|nr:DgyrCDS6056 [Dimorphilus gyrociliatus]